MYHAKAKSPCYKKSMQIITSHLKPQKIPETLEVMPLIKPYQFVYILN
jgi:hypothetical protein